MGEVNNNRVAESSEIRSKPRLSNGMEHFLSIVRKEGSVVDLFLQNGKKLTGTITAFDSYSILISSGGETSLVYKSAIGSVIKFRRRSRKDTTNGLLNEALHDTSRAGQRSSPNGEAVLKDSFASEKTDSAHWAATLLPCMLISSTDRSLKLTNHTDTTFRVEFLPIKQIPLSILDSVSAEWLSFPWSATQAL